MSKFLNAFSGFVQKRENHIHRVAEFRAGGEIEHIRLSPATPCQNIYSIAKVFTATAVGMLVDRGLLSTDDTVTEALGQLAPKSFDPRWKETTVHMLLGHLVGLPVGFMDIDSNDAHAFGDDYLAYVMNHPLRADHGTKYTYTDAAHYILSCIVENRSGLKLDDFLWKELFYPMAFRDAAWSHCPKGHAIGATGLYIRAEDMIKLGMLYLQGGVWQGKRLISENWVETAVARQYDFYPVGTEGAYAKGGMLGQYLLVIPGQQRVVAWQAASGLGQEGMPEFACSYRD